MVIPIIVEGLAVAAEGAAAAEVGAAAAGAGAALTTETVVSGATKVLNTIKETGKVIGNAVDAANQIDMTQKALEGDDPLAAAYHLKGTAKMFGASAVKTVSGVNSLLRS